MTIRAAFFAVRHMSRRFVRDERGVILAIVAVMITVLLGLAGLAFEPGLWYMFRRYDQSAADVAALSGALERAAGKSDTDICTLARSAARLNGFTDPGSCATGLTPGAGIFSLNRPPLSGAYTTSADAVEIVLGRQQNTILARAVAPTLTNVMIRTRAVAGRKNYDSCLVALNTSGQAITVNGGGGSTTNLNMSSCSIISNSTSPDSFRTTGGVQIQAGAISTSGGTKISGTSNTISPPVTTGAAGVTDPYAGKITYSLSGLTTKGCSPGGGGTSKPLQPGLYGGSCAKSSTPPINLASGTTYLCPGVYYLDGEDNKGEALLISGSGTTVAMGTAGANGCPVTLNSKGETINGVTIIATCSTASKCGGGFAVGGTGSNTPTVNLSAPTVVIDKPAGVNIPKEILFYQDASRADTSKGNSTVGGGSGVSLNGVVYLPKTELDLQGNASFGACTELIAGSFGLNGTVSLSRPLTGCGVNTAVAATISLVE